MPEETAKNSVEEKPTEEITNAKAVKQPKKHRVWPWILGFLIIIILIPVVIISFLGFMPGISNILGFNKPADLGVKWTAADYASYQQKTGGQFLDFANAPANPNKPGKKMVFDQPKQMDINLTQEEITATINSVGWLWMPIKNAQIKFNNGGLEASGNVNAAYIPQFVNFIGGVGYPQSEVTKAADYAKLMGNPPIYIKADASVTNNVLTLNVTQAKIGRFNIPLSIAGKVLTNGTLSAKTQATPQGFEAKTVTFSNGQMHFIGTSPTVVYVKKN